MRNFFFQESNLDLATLRSRVIPRWSFVDPKLEKPLRKKGCLPRKHWEEKTQRKVNRSISIYIYIVCTHIIFSRIFPSTAGHISGIYRSPKVTKKPPSCLDPARLGMLLCRYQFWVPNIRKGCDCTLVLQVYHRMGIYCTVLSIRSCTGKSDITAEPFLHSENATSTSTWS